MGMWRGSMGAERPAVALPHDPPVHIMASNGSSNPNHDARQGEAQVCARHSSPVRTEASDSH